MHKVCTKSAQGCIQAIHAAKCANYASMHMPATCTGLHNLQIVRVRKFMCLHNMPKLQSVQKCKVCKFCAVCKMHVCYVRKCRNPSAGLMCIWYKLHSVPTKCAKCIKYASAEPMCMHKLDTARAKCCTLGGGQRLKCCLEDIWGRQPGLLHLNLIKF